MKKLLCVLLVGVILIFAGCTDTNDTEDLLLKDYLEKLDSFEGVVHQYGEEQSRVLLGEQLVATVMYPETGIEDLDAAIDKRINEIISEYQLDVGSKDLAEAAELLVYYNSYVASDEIISVELRGSYSDSSLAHPVEIVDTFVADKNENKLLTIDELLKPDKRKTIENILTETFDIDREFAGSDLLLNWVITGDALKIILPRGEFLPMSDGTKDFVFSKNETADFFKEEHSGSTEAVNPDTAEKDEIKADVSIIDVQIEKDKPMVALTFDDGPSAHTERLLDIFQEYGGKGTFFVLGNTLDNRSESLKRMVLQGHEIGNHSWSHRQFTSIGTEEVRDQIMMTRAKIYDITGVDCKIVRPPYGACNDSIRELGKELGVSFVNWSIDTLDWKSKNADAVYNEIMNDVGDGHIILCHDLHKTTVDAMESVIPDLIAKGYQLVTVTELLTCRGGEISAGKMYYKQVES